MKLAIIGSRNVGGALGKPWAKKGHDVTFGSRDPSADGVKAAAQPEHQWTAVRDFRSQIEERA